MTDGFFNFGRALPWTERAACRGIDNPDVFFPDETNRTTHVLAKAICGDCPVVKECAAYALTHGENYGIWGGLTAPERKGIRNGAKPPASRNAPCGTDAGARAHWRLGEKACGLCMKASSRATMERRARRRERLLAEACGHGTRHMYQEGCRCGPCRQAESRYSKKRYEEQQRSNRQGS